MNVVWTDYHFRFNHYKFISDCLYFPNNLKDIKYPIQGYIVNYKIFFYNKK